MILIENGKLMQDNLRRTRVTLDELTGHLREKDVLDITAVQYAILETDGNLSVFPFPKERPASCQGCGHSPQAPVPPRDHRGGRLPFQRESGQSREG